MNNPDILHYGQTLISLSIELAVWIIMFEIKARKNFKPQYTNVFEDLKFLQQRRYRTLWTDTNQNEFSVYIREFSPLVFSGWMISVGNQVYLHLPPARSLESPRNNFQPGQY